jgi:hypothetical protein
MILEIYFCVNYSLLTSLSLSLLKWFYSLKLEVAMKNVRRLNLNLSGDVFDELARLAKKRKTSMTEVVRLALSLVRIAINEAGKGNKVVICDPAGKPLREVVLPS